MQEHVLFWTDGWELVQVGSYLAGAIGSWVHWVMAPRPRSEQLPDLLLFGASGSWQDDFALRGAVKDLSTT